MTAAEQRAAWFRMYYIKEIASSRFARLIKIAGEEGLLSPIIENSEEDVRYRALRALARLSEQVQWQDGYGNIVDGPDLETWIDRNMGR